MSGPQKTIGQLISEAADAQLRGVDWDRSFNRTVARVDQSIQTSGSRRWRTWGTCAAALVLVVILWQEQHPKSPSILEHIQSGQLSTGSVGIHEDLLFRTDPQTILLAENVHVLQNDPLLKPISVWEQSQRFASPSQSRKD